MAGSRTLFRFSSALLLSLCLAAAAEPPLALVQTITLPQITGGMNHFAADAKRERFFLTGTVDKQLLVVDLKSGKVIKTIGGYSPAAACFAADLNLLCVSGAKAVSIYDGDSFEPVGKIELDNSVDELGYDPKTHRVYAGLQDSTNPAIAVIDLTTRKLVTKIKLPSPAQGFVLEQDGNRIFANTPGSTQVTVVDRDKQAVAAEWKITAAASNYPAALDEKNHRLLIGCRRPALLLVLDTDSGKTVASTEIGGGTDDMSFDPATRRAYLACGGAGVISVVQQQDADHYLKLPPVPSADGARNSLFIPELNRFYLAVPRHEGAELRAYQATR